MAVYIIHGEDLPKVYWMKGDEYPSGLVPQKVKEVHVDGIETFLIRREFDNIPRKAASSSATVWYGDMAKFIAGNFSFSD